MRTCTAIVSSKPGDVALGGLGMGGVESLWPARTLTGMELENGW